MRTGRIPATARRGSAWTLYTRPLTRPKALPLWSNGPALTVNRPKQPTIRLPPGRATAAARCHSEFGADTPVDQVTEAGRVATATISALGLPPEIARASIKHIEDAIASRGPAPVAMTGTELSKFEFILQQKFGADYDARLDRVEAALKKAGPKGGEWLRIALLHSGPMVAASLFDTLSQPQGASR